jgi:hypothetical protein
MTPQDSVELAVFRALSQAEVPPIPPDSVAELARRIIDATAPAIREEEAKEASAAASAELALLTARASEAESQRADALVLSCVRYEEGTAEAFEAASTMLREAMKVVDEDDYEGDVYGQVRRARLVNEEFGRLAAEAHRRKAELDNEVTPSARKPQAKQTRKVNQS